MVKIWTVVWGINALLIYIYSECVQTMVDYKNVNKWLGDLAERPNPERSLVQCNAQL